MKALLSFSVGLALLAAAPQTAHAQISTPQPSPKASVMQRVGLTDVTVTYSRPSAKGRAIFGDSTTKAVVPYARRWRTGANTATTIKFSDDVTVEGKKVPAGEYALYTVPGKTTWLVVLNKDLKLGGNVKDYKDADNVASFSVKPTKLPAKVETFTINFTDFTPATASAELLWETTGVKFKITTDVNTKVMAQIDEKVVKNATPAANDLAAAAVYYFDNNKDLTQALTWIRKANEKEPKFWNLHTQAKIEMKLKDYKAASTTAEQSRKLALDAKNADYVKMNEDLMASAKKDGKL